MATERSKPVKASKLEMATERAKNKDTILILVSASYFNPGSCKIFYLFLWWLKLRFTMEFKYLFQFFKTKTYL